MTYDSGDLPVPFSLPGLGRSAVRNREGLFSLEKNRDPFGCRVGQTPGHQPRNLLLRKQGVQLISLDGKALLLPLLFRIRADRPA